MYRCRYNLTKEFNILNREKVEQLFCGRLSRAEELLEGSFRSSIDVATTLITKANGDLVQFSILSHELQELKKISFFGGEEDSLKAFHLEDIYVVRGSTEAAQLVEMSKKPFFRMNVMTRFDWNDGRAVDSAIFNSIGTEVDEGVIAGIVIRQHRSGDDISKICLQEDVVHDFFYEMAWGSNLGEIMMEYLLEG